MKRSSAVRCSLAVFLLVGALRAQSTDPRLTSWRTAGSAAYARVWETAADKAAGNAVSTWPRSGLLNRGGTSQATPAYSDVQRVVYSANYVYIYTSGLASYTMGPWYDTNGTTLFGMWPVNRGAIHQIPRNPTIPTTKTATRGVGGVLVNGVFLWNNGDAQSYTTSTGTVGFQGQGIWNRLAGPTEGPTFDGGNAHQPTDGQYHNHINPRALRYQLGDAVNYDASTRTYSEGTPAKHSPILGWANDGLPIYGPYGYSSASDATSGVRRMTSGFQKRDGTNGTTNLASTGRTTLAAWSASVQNRSATLASTQYGPAVNTTYPLGTFAEDYDYLGDHGKTQGVDFDLNRQNVRWCVTPEFPAGTYAYFVCIDASGASVFPDVMGQEFFGTPATMQGTVSSIGETVTEYALGGPAAAIAVSAAVASGGATLSWNSVEGATYKVESSADNATWTTLAAAVVSAGTITTYNAIAANNYRVTLTAIATYDTKGTYGTPVGTSGTVAYAAAATAPTITSQPASATVVAGASVTFTVDASGAAPLSYQWRKGGTAIAGATGVSYTIADTATGDAGLYTVTVSNAGGAATSSAATLTVTSATATASRVVNLSARAACGGAAGTPIPGFVLSGAGTKRLLVRAVGPSLVAWGVSPALGDPALTLRAAGADTSVAGNDNWNAADAVTFANVGAFSLDAGSRDAALVTSLAAGAYTAPVQAADGGTGIALVEVYDAGAADDGATLANLSMRAYSGTGDDVLIVGFVISGDASLRLLLRGAGPALRDYGVGEAMADPAITLYQNGVAQADNDNWSAGANATEIAAAATTVGAFAFAGGSKDAAMLLTLPAGVYTMKVAGVSGGTGTALAEIYVLP